MKKAKILFIIDIILSALILIGFGFLAHIVFEYVGEHSNIEFKRRISFPVMIMFDGYIRLAIPIILLCLRNKHRVVGVFRFVSIPFLCILSSIGSFIICASYNKEKNIVTTKKTSLAKVLIIIGIIVGIGKAVLAGVYADWFMKEAFKQLSLGIILFMLFVIVIAYFPLAYFLVGIYAEVMLLFIKPNTKLFKIIKIVIISTLSLIALIAIRIIEKEQIELNNNTLSYQE